MKKILRIAILTAAICLMFAAVSFAATPAVPADLHQSSGSDSSVQIEWTGDISGNPYYQVKYANTISELEGAAIEENYTSTSDYKSGLAAGKSYYVQVRSYYYDDKDHPSKWCEPIEIVTGPNDVGDTVQFTNATTTSVSIKWGKSSGATGYRIEKRLASQSSADYSYVSNVTGTTTTVKNLKSDTEYDVRVLPYRKSSSGFVAYAGWYRGLSNLPTISGKVSGLKVESTLVNTQKMSFKWSKKNVVDGYQIEMYNLKTKKSTKKNITYNADSSQYYDVSPLTFYKVRIRSYVVTSDGTKKYSAWSADNYVHLQQEITGEQVGRKAKVKLNWKKVSGADKYKIYVATSFKGTYKLSGTTKSTKFTLTKCGSKSLKKGKTYYIRLVAEKKVNGKTYKTTVGGSQSIYLYK